MYTSLLLYFYTHISISLDIYVFASVFLSCNPSIALYLSFFAIWLSLDVSICLSIWLSIQISIHVYLSNYIGEEIDMPHTHTSTNKFIQFVLFFLFFMQLQCLFTFHLLLPQFSFFLTINLSIYSSSYLFVYLHFYFSISLSICVSPLELRIN